ILATSSLEADIAKQISKSYDVILKKLKNDKINPVTANIIRLALDGIYYSKMLNIAPLEKEKINEVIQPLLEMTEGERSEEHTSELQSRFDLVCRLLLEKKNINI